MAVLIVLMTVAFAALASNLNVSFGNVTQNALSWNVGFKGSSATATQEGSSNTGLSCGTATITPSTVTISNSTLSKPGDKCTYNLVIQNSGDIAANLSSIIATEPSGYTCTIANNSTMVCGNVTYKLITSSGTALSAGITINNKEMYNIKLVVTYSGEELNSTAVTQSNAKFSLTYTQSSNRTGATPEGVTKPVCKRATTLHTEICHYDEDTFMGGVETGCYFVGEYEDGGTITYGSFGTSGILSSGDAFDCDVNGDGDYDPETERFYYVSGLEGNTESDYAVLIFYTNVADGVANDTATFTYGDNSQSYVGPINAYLQLPSTSQWKNVSLSNQTRQIYNEPGGTTIKNGTYQLPTFTYEGKAARLLSSNELTKACGFVPGYHKGKELYSCEYMLEHTIYSTNDTTVNAANWWFESVLYRYATNYILATDNRYCYITGAGSNLTYGVRPVIEVPLSDIDY